VTWTKLSDDFASDAYRDDLSDAAVRTHVEALCWSSLHLLDGRLRRRDLPRFAFSDQAEAAAVELVAAGYWRNTADGWEIVHHLEHQPTRDEVLRRRKLNADRQRAHRERRIGRAERDRQRPDGGDDPESVTPDITRDVTRDKTRDPGRVGTGRVGTGNSAVTNTVQGTQDDEHDDEAGEVEQHEPAPTCGWCDADPAIRRAGRTVTEQGRPWCGWCEVPA
jgi:hypothetical protein